MKKLINLLCFLLALDVLHESEHTMLLESLGKDLGNQCALVEAGKGDELPAVAHLG